MPWSGSKSNMKELFSISLKIYPRKGSSTIFDDMFKFWFTYLRFVYQNFTFFLKVHFTLSYFIVYFVKTHLTAFEVNIQFFWLIQCGFVIKSLHKQIVQDLVGSMYTSVSFFKQKANLLTIVFSGTPHSNKTFVFLLNLIFFVWEQDGISVF